MCSLIYDSINRILINLLYWLAIQYLNTMLWETFPEEYYLK